MCMADSHQLGYHPFARALRYLLFETKLGPYLGGKPSRDIARFRKFCLAALRERRQAEKATEDDMFHHLLNDTIPTRAKPITLETWPARAYC